MRRLGPAALLVLVLGLLAGPVAAQSVCAVVKIEVRQELTFERQGFEARMRIINDLDSFALEELAIEVLFTDADGNPVVASSDPNAEDADFFIGQPSLDGIDAIDGTDTVAAGTTADIRWLIVPTAGAGGTDPNGQLYLVGATLDYRLRGEPRSVEVVPDFITVRPLPFVILDYFLTEHVFADDPLTPEVEPVEPFTLGVRLHNTGAAPAHDLSIVSAQPEIVENEQGLLIDFRITGSSLDDAPTTPSLLLDFGDLAVGEARVGRWIMETTLSGRFVELDTTISHADELGGELTSLLTGRKHFLVRDVLVDLPGRDRVRDFLAVETDGTGLTVYESHGLDTPVTDQSDQATLIQLPSGRHTLTFPATAGFVYVQVPDPYLGAKEVAEAFRNDGKLLRGDNIWFSKTRNRDTDSWEYWLNLFDANTSGEYTLALEDITTPPSPPALQLIPDRQVREGEPIGFLVEATDPNGTLPTIRAEPMPDGATWTDESSDALARYAFDWTPAVGQAGDYPILYTASDGVLDASQEAVIRVCALADLDCDGVLDRDDADRDGDGIDDIQDNCKRIINPDQADQDRDGQGDACDPMPELCEPCLPSPGGWRAILGNPGIEQLRLVPDCCLSDGEVGLPYNQRFEAIGGKAPYVFALVDGELPPGLTLSEDGRLLGTPGESGDYAIRIRLADRSYVPQRVERDYLLSVTQAPAGITVTPTDGLQTSEAGAAASFTVVLERQPTVDVVLALGSDDESEGTVSPNSLAFTAEDWYQPQSATVTGVDDGIYDGDRDFLIVIVPLSADAAYQDLDAIDVLATNADDDDALDTDGDGLSDAIEDTNGDGDPNNDDADADGLPNYRDSDSDNDSIDDAKDREPLSPFCWPCLPAQGSWRALIPHQVP